MRSLGRIDHFVTGAVGVPGERTFLIEVDTEAGLEWFVLEKQQAAAMAERSLEILRDLGTAPPPPGPDLAVPMEPTFRVGEIGIGIDGEDVMIVLSPTEDAAADPVTFRVTVEILGAMAVRALEVVGAGRPPCRLCGRPRDAAGHVCPTTNGDLRHQP